MLLTYLYANFLEECAFARACGLSKGELVHLIDKRVFPSPSYVYENNGRSRSFVSDFSDNATYRFHLKGHADWLEAIRRFGLDDEDRARGHFFRRYDLSKAAFLSGHFGRRLADAAPDVPGRFDGGHADATWGHFLSGVYGVCTRDGRPESVFLKQAGVMFIEAMTARDPETFSKAELDLLDRAVSFLDTVESDFAPHEAPQSSRQRCIVDVRARYLDRLVA